MSTTLSSGDIVADTWEVRSKIGQGAFSEIFVGQNILDDYGPFVALKVCNAAIDSGVIRWEAEVIKALHVDCIPKYIASGNHEGNEYVVMELLLGEDMSHLRDRVRANSGSGLISLHAASYLARQMLHSIRVMHEHGFIHRDIKPANFVRRDRNSSKFSVIDFGITRQHRDRDGSLRPKRQEAEFRGTTTYASPHSHREEELCPRDDLYSLLYVFLDFVCGKLPWSEISKMKMKDKAKVKEMKEEYREDPQKLVDWVAAAVSDMELSHSDTCQGYDPNFPEIAQRKSYELLSYLKTLEYETIPDYDYIETAFATMIDESSLPDITSEGYDRNGFKWSGSKDKIYSVLQQEMNRDFNQRVKIFSLRLKRFYKQLFPQQPSDTAAAAAETVLIQASDASSGSQNPLEISRKWMEFSKPLINEFPIDVLSSEVFEMMENILNRYGCFYQVDLGENDIDWPYFVELQKRIHQYQEKAERFVAQKRMKMQT